MYALNWIWSICWWNNIRLKLNFQLGIWLFGNNQHFSWASLGSSIVSFMAGAGPGVLMDVGVQTSERITFGMSDGLAGRSEYDFGQIALFGGIGGVAAPALDGLAAFAGSKYNVNLKSLCILKLTQVGWMVG